MSDIFLRFLRFSCSRNINLICFLSLSSFFLSHCFPSYAIGVRRLDRQRAVQGYTIPVTPLGVAISFIEVGETVEYVQVSPVGEITVTGNRPLCQSVARVSEQSQELGGFGSAGGFPGLNANSTSDSNCSNPVQVLFLKRVAPIFIPGQLPSPSGNALLQVITRGPEGSYLYQFNLVPSNKKPEFTVVNISGRLPVAGSQLLPVTAPPPPSSSSPSFSPSPTFPSSDVGEGVRKIPNFGVPRPSLPSTPAPAPSGAAPPTGSGSRVTPNPSLGAPKAPGAPPPPAPSSLGAPKAPGAPPPPAPSSPPSMGFPSFGNPPIPPNLVPPGVIPPGVIPPGAIPPDIVPPGVIPPGGF